MVFSLLLVLAIAYSATGYGSTSSNSSVNKSKVAASISFKEAMSVPKVIDFAKDKNLSIISLNHIYSDGFNVSVGGYFVDDGVNLTDINDSYKKSQSIFLQRRLAALKDVHKNMREKDAKSTIEDSVDKTEKRIELSRTEAIMIYGIQVIADGKNIDDLSANKIVAKIKKAKIGEKLDPPEIPDIVLPRNEKTTILKRSGNPWRNTGEE